jgi:2',3'-cyclic-nucleotide 2'-phosphodiesterase / 3'-nucleotidase
VFTARQTIRQLLVDWARARGRIDPADFFHPNWRLVREGVPLF